MIHQKNFFLLKLLISDLTFGITLQEMYFFAIHIFFDNKILFLEILLEKQEHNVDLRIKK